MKLGQEIAGGIAWTIAARWCIRGIGLVSTIILARVLAPQEFGVVAMGTLAAGLLEIFSETGLLLFLIRKADPDRTYFDTVWTLRMIVGALIGTVIFLTAPVAVQFFNEPLVGPVMQVLALKPILAGLENTGIVWFRKNMNFGKDFQFLLGQKVAAFATTIPLAFIISNHWALVFGILAGSVASVILSYALHSYRPRFSLAHTREVFGFSLWLLAIHVVGFFNDRIDEFVVGRFKSTQAMGLYSVAADVGAAPIQEIIYPTARVLFPAYAKIAHNQSALSNIFERYFCAVALLAFALGPGMASVAPDFVAVILGAKWAAMAPTLTYLAISAGIAALSIPHLSLLPIVGREKIATYLSVMRVVLLAGVLSLAALNFDLEIIAAARAVVMALTLVITLIVCARVANLRLSVPLRGSWRPMAAAAAMVLAVNFFQNLVIDIPAIRLFGSVIIGGFTYAGVVFGLWIVAGKPASIEYDLLILMRMAWGRLTSRLIRS